METTEYFQPLVACRTSFTIVFAVIFGPESILMGSFCPVASTLMCVPPTSMTRMRFCCFGMSARFGMCAPAQEHTLNPGISAPRERPPEKQPAHKPGGLNITEAPDRSAESYRPLHPRGYGTERMLARSNSIPQL